MDLGGFVFIHNILKGYFKGKITWLLAGNNGNKIMVYYVSNSSVCLKDIG